MVPNHLAELLRFAATTHPDRVAVEEESGRAWTYAELDHQTDRIATTLQRWGVGPGDRVGIFAKKSLETVAGIHGILRAGAAYVPVDATGPLSRAATIFTDAQVRVVLIDSELVRGLGEQLTSPAHRPRLIVIGDPIQAAFPELDSLTLWQDLNSDGLAFSDPSRSPDDLAYLLYTSGSTGKPKGVMLTHANAFCFLDWCQEAFDLRGDDRFSSHAPFHFDLSTFDLYMASRTAATLVLIGESTAKEPAKLGLLITEKRISIWYSAPSILTLLSQFGGIAEPGRLAPRLVLFAGEVFPIPHLKRLRSTWPDAELWNLYGPTETNVCTAFRIPNSIDTERSEPFPIGPACLPLRGRVIDPEGCEVAQGAIGELAIHGPGVMRGYHGRPDLTEQVMLTDADGQAWYRTGDLVVDLGQGVYQYRGRRDRMVKKRGYRIELGEVEAALHRHETVAGAAVIARDEPEGVAIQAYVELKPGRKKSLIAMKRHCGQQLPHYMIPDSVAFLDQLPQTSTSKVDYQKLKQISTAG